MQRRLSEWIAPPPQPSAPSDEEKDLHYRLEHSQERVEREIIVMNAIRESMKRDEDR